MMYIDYIINELYTFIEKRRSLVSTKAYLNIGESVCFHLFLPRKQIVSLGETKCFHGGN